MKLTTVIGTSALFLTNAGATPVSVDPIMDPNDFLPLLTSMPAVETAPPTPSLRSAPASLLFPDDLTKDVHPFDGINELNHTTRHLLNARAANDDQPECTKECLTFFAIKFDRRAKETPEGHDDQSEDQNRTPHIQLIAGRGGWPDWGEPIELEPEYKCTQGCDVDDRHRVGDTRVTKWVKLQCRKANFRDWELFGGGWERVDLEPIREKGTRPGIPSYIDIHPGNYCKRDPYDEDIGHNVWLRYKGIIYNMADDCAYVKSKRLFADPWIGRCVFGANKYEG